MCYNQLSETNAKKKYNNAMYKNYIITGLELHVAKSVYKNKVFWINVNCNVIFQISIKENDVITSLMKTEDDLYLPIRIFVRVYVCQRLWETKN